jgi:hypothetical protein
VGLIGHRQIDPEILIDLRIAARDTLAKVRAAAIAAAGSDGSSGVLDLRCVCCLAEGADVILTEEALIQGYALSAALPFHRDTYLEDFPTEAARKDFTRLLGTAYTCYELNGTRAGALGYQAVGRLLLEQSDIIVAIWDGRPAVGPGGLPMYRPSLSPPRRPMRSGSLTPFPVMASTISRPSSTGCCGTNHQLALRMASLASWERR